MAKNISVYSFFLLFLCFPLSDYGQSYERQWAFFSGASFVHYSGNANLPDLNYSFYDPAYNFRLSKYVNRWIDNSFEYMVGPRVHYPITADLPLRFLLTDIQNTFVIKGHNSFIFKETTRIGPYIKTGIGLNVINRKSEIADPQDITNQSDVFIPVGVGARLRIESQAHFHIDVVKRFSMSGKFQPLSITAGVAFSFGKNKHWEKQYYLPIEENLQVTFLEPQDNDGDGIMDLQDACPLEAGSPQFSGCPTDRSSVPGSIPKMVQKDEGLETEELIDITSLGSFDKNLTSDENIEDVGKSNEVPQDKIYKSDPRNIVEEDTDDQNAHLQASNSQNRPLLNNAIRKTPCPMSASGGTVSQNISYEIQETGLPVDAQEFLTQAARLIQDCPGMSLDITTYVSKYSTKKNKIEVAEKQSVMLKYYLVQEHGVEKDRISISGVLKAKKGKKQAPANLQIAKLTFLMN